MTIFAGVHDGKIVDPRPIIWEEQINPDVQIDCNGLIDDRSIISPGFDDV